MGIKEDIRGQILAALHGATFPINSPQELFAILPPEKETVCPSGNVRMTSGEVQRILKEGDFPFKNANQAADVILKRAGI